MKILTAACLILAGLNGQSLVLSDAASYQQNVAISPGAIVTLKGSNLTDVVLVAPDPTHPPTNLGGVTLTVNGVACGLYYVSPSQINAVIDPSVPAGIRTVMLQSSTLTAQTTAKVQAPTSAGIFTLTGTGSGDGAIVNPTTGNEGAFSVVTAGGATYLSLYATSLDKTQPIVWVGGTSVFVQYFGDQGSYPGMQQINIQLPPSLQGAGRVEIVIEQNGRRSNAVDAVLLPSLATFFNDQPNQIRSRELASVAWIPGTSTALIADENDDVVRVIDIGKRAITHVIALPDGAEPQSIGVNAAGSLAVVTERARGAIALIDLASFKVVNEFPTGYGASSVAIAGDQAVITNSDADTVSFFSFSGMQVAKTLASGRLPRAVAVDSGSAYVTNQSDGTVTVYDLNAHTITNTFNLGQYTRPAAIQMLPTPQLALIAEPSAGPGGRLILMTPTTGQFVSIQANPDNTGGASSIAVSGSQVYLANQSGATVTTGSITNSSITQTTTLNNPVNLKVDAGARSIALDPVDGLLLTACESDGKVVLTDLGNNTVTARIDALRVDTGDIDDHSDRQAAPNLPSITSAAPTTVSSGTSTTMLITGTNLTNASTVLFIDPSTVPSLTRGSGNVNRGNFGVSDPAIIVTGIQAKPDGTQLTVKLQISQGAAARTRVIRVLTPNGETSLASAPSVSLIM